MRILTSLFPFQYLLPSAFVILAILTGMKWLLTVVLISILLMQSDVETRFMGMLAVCIRPQKNVCSNPLSVFYWVFTLRFFFLAYSRYNSLLK